MAWRYKLYDIQPEQVVTIDPINDNFLAFHSEVSGALNEHNFNAAPGVFARSDFSDDATCIIHQVRGGSVLNTASSYNQVQALSRGDISRSGFKAETGWAIIEAKDGWQSFTDGGLLKTITAKGGPAYMFASLNLHCGENIVRKPDGTAMFHSMGFGYLVALRVNGSVLHETILGSGDAGVDFFGQKALTRRALESSPGVPRTPDRLENPQGGGGLAGARLPVVVDAVVDLPAGENRIEVVVMNIKGTMSASEFLKLSFIGRRELSILELVR
jgi:hypothetical protein